MTTKERTCEERIEAALRGRLEDLQTCWDAYMAGEDETDELGSIYDYGLSLNYVAPGTFDDQREGFLCYQISTGGPGDEFRFFFSPSGRGGGWSAHRVEYWFLDWFDGAHRVLAGADLDLLAELFDWFEETGTVSRLIDETEPA